MTLISPFDSPEAKDLSYPHTAYRALKIRRYVVREIPLLSKLSKGRRTTACPYPIPQRQFQPKAKRHERIKGYNSAKMSRAASAIVCQNPERI